MRKNKIKKVLFEKYGERDSIQDEHTFGKIEI